MTTAPVVSTTTPGPNPTSASTTSTTTTTPTSTTTTTTTTTTVAPAMMVPRDLTAASHYSPTVTLDWNEPLYSSCESSLFCPKYRIEQSINGADWQLAGDGRLSSVTTANFYSVNWGDTYTYRVAQVDNNGVGPWAQTSITPSTTPDEPDWAEACRIGDSDNYQISWGSNDGEAIGDGGSPITGYLLEWGYGSTADQVIVGSSPYVLTSLGDSVQVYSINANGQSRLWEYVQISSYSTQSMC